MVDDLPPERPLRKEPDIWLLVGVLSVLVICLAVNSCRALLRG